MLYLFEKNLRKIFRKKLLNHRVLNQGSPPLSRSPLACVFYLTNSAIGYRLYLLEWAQGNSIQMCWVSILTKWIACMQEKLNPYILFLFPHLVLRKTTHLLRICLSKSINLLNVSFYHRIYHAETDKHKYRT